MMQTRTVGGATTGFFLSLVFAFLLLGIQTVEFWLESWVPAEGQSAPITLRLPAFTVFRLHLGQPAELEQRQVIIGQGELIEPNEDARLAAAYEQTRRESQVGWGLGVFLVSLVAALLLLAELRRAPGGGRLLRTQVTILVAVLLFAAGAKGFLLLTSLPAYYFPMPAIVLLSAFLLGRRVALAVNIFISVIFASLLGFDLSALVVLFTTSYAGTLFLRNRKKRSAVFLSGSLSGWFGALALLVLMLVFSGSINIHRELLNPDYSAVLAAVACGVFSGIVALVLIEPVGWLVGRVSPSKLLELQDLDSPVLKKIRDESPGTWEHSRAAANLAEAAAAAIGADSLLVRVGAYIHDAGKALNPGYFIENQTTLNMTNPHNELEPDVSADCIFDHVREGTELLRKHHVPETVVEFAYTHHGTSLLEYFWVKNMRAGNPKNLKERVFRYPGMRPRSRETGILMIVDAIEAASRTIKEPAKHKFEALVQRIIYTKLNQGQLDECGLTLADLKAVTTTLVDSLVNMYHARIEYPWQQTGTQTGQHAVIQTGPHPSTFQSGQHATIRESGQMRSGQFQAFRDTSASGQYPVVGNNGAVADSSAPPLSGQYFAVSEPARHEASQNADQSPPAQSAVNGVAVNKEAEPAPKMAPNQPSSIVPPRRTVTDHGIGGPQPETMESNAEPNTVEPTVEPATDQGLHNPAPTDATPEHKQTLSSFPKRDFDTSPPEVTSGDDS